jgi:hypothetical protein
MMFKPDNRPYPADYMNLNVLNRAKRYPITNSEVEWLFGYGTAVWIRVYKVVRGTMGEVKLISRDYCLPTQRDEFIGDMFDIAHYHRIVGLSEPHDLYVEETATEGSPIEAETIEAIVGKVYG